MSMEPSICETVKTGNPRLQFLLDCFRYNPVERPAATFISRGLQQCVLESTAGYILTRLKDMRTAASSFSVQREGRSPQSQISSFLFPGRRIVNSARSRKFDPLMRQQIEWNVKQVSEMHLEQNFSLGSIIAAFFSKGRGMQKASHHVLRSQLHGSKFQESLGEPAERHQGYDHNAAVGRVRAWKYL